ncbi:MAG: alpha/beta hydrolase [Saprospiraceae bacterium]
MNIGKIIVGILITAFFVSGCSTYKNIPKLQQMSDLQYKYPVKYVELNNNVNLAYVDMGKGDKTLILIHGLGSYSPAWNQNIDELSKFYRIIAVDLPGYGKSSKIPHSGKMTYYGEVIMDLIDKLNLKNVSIAGHSMGGQIAITIALQFPDKIEKLILVDPAGFEDFHPGQRKWFKDVMTPNLVRLTTVESIETNLATNFYNMPKSAQFMIDDRIAIRTAKDFDAYCLAVSRSVAGMVDEPVVSKLKDIKVPTLIFFGRDDMLIPNRYLNPGFTKDIAEFGDSQIKNSKLIMVPKCGHFMMFEKPQVFNEEVLNFIK